MLDIHLQLLGSSGLSFNIFNSIFHILHLVICRTGKMEESAGPRAAICSWLGGRCYRYHGSSSQAVAVLLFEIFCLFLYSGKKQRYNTTPVADHLFFYTWIHGVRLLQRSIIMTAWFSCTCLPRLGETTCLPFWFLCHNLQVKTADTNCSEAPVKRCDYSQIISSSSTDLGENK